MADTLDPLSPSLNDSASPGLVRKLRMRFGRNSPPRPPGDGKY